MGEDMKEPGTLLKLDIKKFAYVVFQPQRCDSEQNKLLVLWAKTQTLAKFGVASLPMCCLSTPRKSC